MGWKEVVAKFKPIAVKAEGKQVGGIIVNVENKTENITYNININDPEAARIIVSNPNPIPDFERRVKKETERRLIGLGISPQHLSDGTKREIVLATTGASVASLARVEGNLTFKSDLDVKIKPASSTESKK